MVTMVMDVGMRMGTGRGMRMGMVTGVEVPRGTRFASRRRASVEIRGGNGGRWRSRGFVLFPSPVSSAFKPVLRLLTAVAVTAERRPSGLLSVDRVARCWIGATRDRRIDELRRTTKIRLTAEFLQIGGARVCLGPTRIIGAITTALSVDSSRTRLDEIRGGTASLAKRRLVAGTL